MSYRGVLAVALVGAAAIGSAASASAQGQGPVYQAAVRGGWYVWVDGSYQQVKLPNFDLGWHHLAVGAPFLDRGPAESYDPDLKGAGVSGAVGYFLPRGTLPAMFGA